MQMTGLIHVFKGLTESYVDDAAMHECKGLAESYLDYETTLHVGHKEAFNIFGAISHFCLRAVCTCMVPEPGNVSLIVSETITVQTSAQRS